MKKIRVVLILFSTFMLVQGFYAQTQKAEALDVRLAKSQMVPMRDGVRLSTDLYFPLDAGKKLPAILIRTPYNKKDFRDKEKRAQAYMFASHGFVVAVQDCRGKYESEGIYSPPAGQEAEDGYDTVGWLAQQAWSNGKIGTSGCSYPSEVQAAQAPLRHPNLTCMILLSRRLVCQMKKSIRSVNFLTQVRVIFRKLILRN
jgi:predicted acyl esterase